MRTAVIAPHPSESTLVPVSPERLKKAKKAYTTRFLAKSLEGSPSGLHLLTGPDVRPLPGDAVLARVDKIGQLPRLESPASRRQTLFSGDEIIVAYGHRYAPDQVFAEVPPDLRECQLVAAGGLASEVRSSHGSLGKPTQLTPIGLLADVEGRLNLRRFAPHAIDPASPHRVSPRVIAVVGTSMNAGKSTAGACLSRGLVNAGLRVSAGKITGTGAGGDPLLFRDAGAAEVLDFTDFGYATTFRLEASELLALAVSMVNALAASAPHAIVVEIADGLFQTETRCLLNDPILHGLVDVVLFAASDALGASAGVSLLRDAGLAPAAVSGALTASPLATAEAAAALDIPVLESYSLTEADTAKRLLASSTA